MYNLKDVNSFILNYYIDEINKFLGEEVIPQVNEELASRLDNDTVEFFRKLVTKITEFQKDKTYCVRNCCFRKRGKK